VLVSTRGVRAGTTATRADETRSVPGEWVDFMKRRAASTHPRRPHPVRVSAVRAMKLIRLTIHRFTAFEDATFELGRWVNVFIGENG
jgi:hypothetical protein